MRPSLVLCSHRLRTRFHHSQGSCSTPRWQLPSAAASFTNSLGSCRTHFWMLTSAAWVPHPCTVWQVPGDSGWLTLTQQKDLSTAGNK